MTTFFHDLRYAARTLFKQPGSTLVAILALDSPPRPQLDLPHAQYALHNLALLAWWLPARRAAGVDRAIALREG